MRSSSIGHRPAGARSLSLLIPCRVSASALQVKVSSSIPHPLSLSLPLPLPLLHTPISATHRSSYTTPTTPTNSTPNTPHLPHTPLTPMGRRKIEIQPITVRTNTHHHSRPNPIFNPTPDPIFSSLTPFSWPFIARTQSLCHFFEGLSLFLCSILLAFLAYPRISLFQSHSNPPLSYTHSFSLSSARMASSKKPTSSASSAQSTLPSSSLVRSLPTDL